MAPRPYLASHGALGGTAPPGCAPPGCGVPPRANRVQPQEAGVASCGAALVRVSGRVRVRVRDGASSMLPSEHAHVSGACGAPHSTRYVRHARDGYAYSTRTVVHASCRVPLARTACRRPVRVARAYSTEGRTCQHSRRRRYRGPSLAACQRAPSSARTETDR
eukprot:scaffold32471_cov44-Phaeocystis_antarctica.AAC.3